MTVLRRALAGVACGAVVLASSPANAAKPSWDLSLIIDQSCSMAGNDPAGFAMVAPAIFADLSTHEDSLWLFPQGSASRFQLVGEGRTAFKRELALAMSSSSDSDWRPYFHQAAQRMGASPVSRDHSLLVMLYDGDWTETFSGIQQLKQPIDHGGGDGFVIGVGSNFGAEERAVMEMFGEGHNTAVRPGDGAGLLQGFAQVFGHILHSKPPPVGSADPNDIRVTVAPQVDEAWLVVLGDREVTDLKATGVNPSATAVRREPETGWTHPDTGRSYQIVHLLQPNAGPWTFSAKTRATQVNWLLLQTFSYGKVTIEIAPDCVVGAPCEVQARPDSGELPENVAVEVRLPNGTVTTLQRQADGSYGGDVVFDSSGRQEATIVVSGDHLRQERRVRSNVRAVEGTLDCSSFQGLVAPSGAPVTVVLKRPSSHIPLQEAWVQIAGGQRIPLLEQTPMEFKADLVMPATLGPVEVVASSTAMGNTNRCSATFDLRPRVLLGGAPGPVVEAGPVVLASPRNPVFSACDPGDERLEATRDPEARCTSCGACAGGATLLDLSAGTVFPEGTSLQGTLTLDGIRSAKGESQAGVRVFLATGDPAEAELKLGRPVPLTLDKNGTVPLAVCINRCPSPAGTVNLDLRVDVPDVFDASSGAGPTTVSKTITLKAEVAGSSFWTCWGWLVVLVTGTGLLLFVIGGFVYPLRFGSGGMPKRYKTQMQSEFANIGKDSSCESPRSRGGWSWWREGQKISLMGTNFELSPFQQSGDVQVWLRKQSKDDMRGAYIHSPNRRFLVLPLSDVGGLPLDKALEFQEWSEDEHLLKPAETRRLRVDHIYVPLLENDDIDKQRRCFIFFSS